MDGMCGKCYGKASNIRLGVQSGPYEIVGADTGLPNPNATVLTIPQVIMLAGAAVMGLAGLMLLPLFPGSNPRYSKITKK